MRRMAAFVIITTLLIAAPLAWLAGEQHRENCIRLELRSCSVLPWDGGIRPATQKEYLVPLP